MLNKMEQKVIHLTDQQIFTTIWTSPLQVFKFINDNGYDKHVKVLLILAGISSAFDSFKDFAISLIALIALCIVFGAIFGWLSCYIFAALITWIRRLAEG